MNLIDHRNCIAIFIAPIYSLGSFVVITRLDHERRKWLLTHKKKVEPKNIIVAWSPFSKTTILRLVSAILMDISEEWESGKTYLPQISYN